jgi:TM2 domain-containing membrane protein YozV
MKDRTTAILLCFFCGWFGIHKFYLGQTFAGVMYLIFSWTCIPGIISFFEFLGLCFMSDREFHTRYSSQYLPSQFSTPPAIDTTSSKDATSALYDLKKLYEDGVITAEEYEAKRRKMLDRI